MTYKEAKVHLTNKQCNDNGLWCELAKDDKPCDDKCMDYFALEKAIESLDKQIPKKPYFEADGYADGELVYDTWICPSCGKDYEVDYDDYTFCPKCGQAIDWGEE